MAGGVVNRGGGSGRRGRRRRTGRSHAMAEINVTPMVDVMLVLLIIFMVSAPLLTVGVPVQLPKTAATALPTEKEEPLTVTLTEDGKIMVQKTEVQQDQLIPRLRSIASERKDDKLYLRADGKITYDRVAQVMGALNAAGFHDIGLVTDSNGPSFGGGPNGGGANGGGASGAAGSGSNGG
ncbi:protein TolR [Acidimangrovimonas sediminis]|uniref:protein TolR n=1 Tax=Acidimangrovimonas sediminis TaxID=2056283 RepID=UPI000C7FA835|nr:protein TolR [Acidimangrovimonas sediminis]